MEPYKLELAEISKVVLGSAAKTLLRSRDRESEMGNFVADAMLRALQNKTMSDGSSIRKYQCDCDCVCPSAQVSFDSQLSGHSQLLYLDWPWPTLGVSEHLSRKETSPRQTCWQPFLSRTHLT